MWYKLVVLVAAFSLVTPNLTPRKLYKDNDGQDLITSFSDPFDNQDYRLPNSTVPLRYDIWLSTDIHRGVFDFNGLVAIQIMALENTPDITLHYRELTIVTVNLFNSNGVLIQSNVPTTRREDVEFLIIRPTQPFVEGQTYSVQLNYRGVLRTDDAGFYRSSYVNTLGQTVWLATTQFESTDARHAFPW